MLKKIASKLPIRLQQEMKKYYFRRKIKKGLFCSDELEFNLLEKLIVPGDFVIDVGANIGHYTLKFSKLVGDRGHVIAMEPIPATFELLVSNAGCIPCQNVTFFNCAASSSSAFSGFDLPEFENGLINYYRAHLTDQSGEFSALCLPIDCLDLDNSVRLVKIDVEGHEYAVLLGMEKILSRDHPVLIVEGFDDNVTTFLVSLDYKVKRLAGSPNRIFYYGSL